MSKNQRPGMVTFAGIVMFLVAGFHGLIAISEFTQSDWLADIPLGLFSSSYLLWGFIDAILALIAYLHRLCHPQREPDRSLPRLCRCCTQRHALVHDPASRTGHGVDYHRP